MIDKNVLEAKAEFIVDNMTDCPPKYDVNVNTAKEGIRMYAEYLLDEVYEHIKHGDEEHMKWLKDKCEELKREL